MEASMDGVGPIRLNFVSVWLPRLLPDGGPKLRIRFKLGRSDSDEFGRTRASVESAAVRNRTLRLDQNDLARLIGKSQHQHFRSEFTDLLRSEVYHRRHLPPDQ